MAKDKHRVSIKLSPELRQQLKTYKASRGKRSLAAAAEEILATHFHLTHLPTQQAATNGSIERIATLEARVTYLSEQLEALKQAIATNQAHDSAPKPNVIHPASSPVSMPEDDDDDDMYDEPDEILYNFLEPGVQP